LQRQGTVNEINPKKIIPNPKLSIKAGWFCSFGRIQSSWIFKQLEIIGENLASNQMQLTPFRRKRWK
jgi:hypothetical protein